MKKLLPDVGLPFAGGRGALNVGVAWGRIDVQEYYKREKTRGRRPKLKHTDQGREDSSRGTEQYSSSLNQSVRVRVHNPSREDIRMREP